MKIFGAYHRPVNNREALALKAVIEFLKQNKKKKLVPYFIQDITCMYCAEPIVYALQEVARICANIFAGVISALIVHKILSEKEATRDALKEIEKRQRALQRSINKVRRMLKDEKSAEILKMAADYIYVAETIHMNKEKSGVLIGKISYRILKKRK